MSKLKKAESKLGSLGAKGKASDKPAKKPSPKPDGIVHSSQTIKPTSVRLTTEDKANLAQIVQAVNGVSRGKVSSTKVIQALLQMGAEMPPERVLKAVRGLL